MRYLVQSPRTRKYVGAGGFSPRVGERRFAIEFDTIEEARDVVRQLGHGIVVPASRVKVPDYLDWMPRAVVLALALLTSTGCMYTFGGNEPPPPSGWDDSTRAACLDFADELGSKQVSCKMSPAWVDKTAASMRAMCDRTRPDTDVGTLETKCIDRVDFADCAALGNLSNLCPELKLWWN